MIQLSSNSSNKQQSIAAFRIAYLRALMQGSGRQADQVIEQSLGEGLSVDNLYLDIFQPSAYEIGHLWQLNQVSVAQEHLATAIIERQMGDLHHLFKPIQSRQRKVLIGCVEREFHRIGARMVADFFERDGWNVFFLASAVPTDTFIDIAQEITPDLVGLSCQMVYHLPAITDFVRRLDTVGLGGIPVMAGGYPFVNQPELYKKLGVRFSGADAASALALANTWVLKENPE
jgi:methanogenic corrinoid protein MtbC1